MGRTGSYGLTRRDFEQVLEFLQGLYRPAAPEALTSYFLESAPKLLPAGHFTMAWVRPASRTGGSRSNPPELSAPEMDEKMLASGDDCPTFVHFRKTALSKFIAVSEIVTKTDFRRTNYYNEMARPFGLNDVCALYLPPISGEVALFAITLERTLSARQKSLLDTIERHLSQAYTNARQTANLTDNAERAQRVLDKLESGVVFVDAKRNIKFETARASALMTGYFGARNGAHLCEPIDLWLARADAELRNATDLPATRCPLIVERPGRRLIVRVFSEPNEHMLVLEERRTSIDPDSLAPLGLTKRQSEILAYIAMGKTNPEIAIILDISRRTVDKLVQQVLLRLNVENRTSAATMALDCSANLPPRTTH
jgi:DNA-binding CsgD family transcriptional regulator